MTVNFKKRISPVLSLGRVGSFFMYCKTHVYKYSNLPSLHLKLLAEILNYLT